MTFVINTDEQWLIPKNAVSLRNTERIRFMLAIDIHTVIYIWIAALLMAAIAQILSTKKEHVFSLSNYARIPGSISFNQDRITFMFEQDRSYVDWKFFKCYIECNNQIYLFPAHKSGSIISFSSSDVGAVNYDQLKQIIRTKKIACKCRKANKV